VHLARGQSFCTRPSNWSYVRNWHKQGFFGTKNFLHSANLQAAIPIAGFLQVPLKSSFKKLLLGTGLWHHTKMSTSLKSLDRLKDAECKKGQLSHWPPIPYVPVVDIITPRKNPRSSRSSFPMRPTSACPFTLVETTMNTLHTLLQSSKSSKRRGCPRSAQCLPRLL
jgi:hypothetical protein